MKSSNSKLSVVLAIHNEAEMLGQCLESVQKIADEIVIVDGESSDESATIAKQFSARIITAKNVANFHINKQKAIDAARNELILQLDADEVVTPGLAAFISTIKQHPDKFQSTSAWWIKRRNYFLGTWLKKGGQYPDPVIRLFWKGQAELPQKDVHEQMRVLGKTDWAEGCLEHFSSPSLTVYLRKMNTYSSFAAAQLHHDGVKPTFSILIAFFVSKPIATFVQLYFRHKGLLDGIAGFLFALLSALHFPLQFLKLWELSQYEKN
ncbi:glycosyltransferase family 2 protein [Candidatus Woesebacteria bacterium]|nr:glycosyltransferase family 2 protein [Candidatus Woesebacteria bacterium]